MLKNAVFEVFEAAEVEKQKLLAKLCKHLKTFQETGMLERGSGHDVTAEQIPNG